MTSDGTYTYEYDKEGNRTKRTKTSTNESTEYEWDYHNRLVKVTEKDSMGMTTKVVEYTYDVFNRRIAKQVDTTNPFDMADAAIERYVYDDIHNGLVSLDGGNVVLDFADPDGSGTQPMVLAKRYLYGQQVDQILAQEVVTKNLSETDRVLWPLVDNLGTVRDLAKQDGTIATHYQYDSYGNVTSGDTSLTRYLFTSRELDTDTGLQYNRARWYDPTVGRWISEDPLGFVAGDGNIVRYVGNGVTAKIDPSGLDALDDLLGRHWRSRFSDDERKLIEDFVRRSEEHGGRRGRYSLPPVTYVRGVFGGAYYLNDSYFLGRPIPTVVCHGVCGDGVVGPPNSFRFPGGPAQLQMYQSIRDTVAGVALIVGFGITGGTSVFSTVGRPRNIFSMVVLQEEVAGVPFMTTTVGDMVAGYFITVPYLVGGAIIAAVSAYPFHVFYVGENIADALDPAPPTTPGGMLWESYQWARDQEGN